MLDVLQGLVFKLHGQYLTGKSKYNGSHSYSKVIRAQRPQDPIVYTSWRSESFAKGANHPWGSSCPMFALWTEGHRQIGGLNRSQETALEGYTRIIG